MEKLTLIMYLFAGDFESKEKVSLSVKDRCFYITGESFRDSIPFQKFDRYIHGRYLWESEDRYVKVHKNKKGIAVFTGYKDGSYSMFMTTHKK